MNIFRKKGGIVATLTLITSFLLLPNIAIAQPGVDSSIVPDCGPGQMCGYCDLIELAQNIMNFLVFIVATIAILLFVHAGFIMLTGGASESQRTKAKRIFRVTVFGLILTLISWLLVNLLMAVFLDTSFGSPWTLPGCPGSVSS